MTIQAISNARKHKVACLHAHHSNIFYIDQAFAGDHIEFTHFVEPGLLQRITNDASFSSEDARQKSIDTIHWINLCRMDLIIVTCTAFCAALPEDMSSCPTPIIKIDDPFIHALCSNTDPQLVLFTNPATVSGTMNRLLRASSARKVSLEVEHITIQHSFELIMKGEKELYLDTIVKAIHEIRSNTDKIISVAQLSMVDAAKAVEAQSGITIGNPLDSLREAVRNRLEIHLPN